MIKQLKTLFKSGIVFFVVISAIAGYGIGFPIEESFSFLHFVAMVLGTTLISSGSLALNQIQEISRDKKMERTQKRPLATGEISKKTALIISISNMVVGSSILFWVNPVTCYIGLSIIALYNGLYTLHWKPKWMFAAVPGAVPGALPGVLGFSAVNNNLLSPESVYLFLVMFLWQMPHFWTLAIRFADDYERGEFPILPVVVGKERTIYHISFYVFAYALLAIMAPFFVSFFVAYFVLMIPFALMVVWEFFKYAKSTSEKAWLPFFLWTNFSLLVFLYAPLADKYIRLYMDVFRYQ
ncbi:MAG: heme o synthase [Bacteriovoracaceae bacterium]|nr:heme o synthase [Bacteriovoracaceae bacterium]